MDLGIKGKWALVGGASKGLGYGCAQSLAREGVNLVIVARGAEALEAIGNALQRCTFNVKEHRIEGTQEAIKDLEDAVYKYLGSRKNMFGDQIDGPINELIAELRA